MIIPPSVAPQNPVGQTDAQVRAILRNLTAKTLSYFSRNEVSMLRLMSEHLLDLAQQAGAQSSNEAYRWRSISFLLDKQAAVPSSVYQDALKEALQEEVGLALQSGARGADTAPKDALDGMTLTLIDASEMDRIMSLDVVSQRFNSHFEAPLSTLSQRMGMLLCGEVTALTANPFRPEVLVRALMQGWKNSGFDEPTCQELLACLQPAHSIDLAPLYEDMNATLTKAGVAIKTTHRIRKSANGVGPGSSAGPSDFGALDEGAGATGHASFAHSEQGTGYGGFAQSEQGTSYGSFARSVTGASRTRHEVESSDEPDSEPSRWGGMPSGFGGGVPSAGAPGQGRLSPLKQSIATHARQFLHKLGFQGASHAGEYTVPSEMVYTPVDAGLMGYLGGLQADGGAAFIPEHLGALDPSEHNVLRRMREHEQVRQAPEIDRGTVDALAEVFDFVFADAAIPAQLKVIIARLQIPVLKAAMIDREFFHSAEHPARQLIDTLAKNSVTWNVEKGEQDPLYLQIERTVQRALHEFSDELALFDELRLEFEEFQRLAQQQADQQIAPVAQVEQSDEALALARAHADEVVHARINALPAEAPLAPLLLPFLTMQWREVLSRGWMKVNIQPEIWNNALTTMDQLIWSTQPHTVTVERRQRDPNPSLTPPVGERRQLMRVLPEMVRSLGAGLDSIRWSGTAREEFMHGLMELHMRAVRTAPPTPEELQRREHEAQAGAQALLALDQRRSLAQSVPRDEFERKAQSLTRGLWFDYLNERSQLHRCRLSWISPKRTRLLFTNREGFDAFVRSEREVAELLRESRLMEIDQAPIVARALDQILAQS